MKMHHWFGVCAASAMLVACGGWQTASNPPGQVPAGRLACAKAGAGEAHCLVRPQFRTGIDPNVAGWAPADFQARYKLPSGTKGSGQIVALIDPYDNPNVASDLAAYRSEFGLGTGTFYKYNQDGQQGDYPQGNQGWGVEIDLEVEMVSATCPLCTIDLIEANSPAGSDLQAALAEAVKLGAHVINADWACDGWCVSQHDFDHKGVTYVAPDAGAYPNLEPPSAYDSVAAIGGTILSKSGSQYSETISPYSTGGCATGVKKPKWQHDTTCSYRLGDDAGAVAADVAEYDSYGYSGWFTASGTPVSSALIAGIFGLAGNATHQDGGRTFWLKNHHKDLYAIGGQCSGSTMGRYNTCTGWGSPDGLAAL
jgi:hypothetical protein